MNDEARITVLHVDDEPDIAELVADFLEREDDRFTVETAEKASEGLDLLADEEFDCIVSDYEMPGPNGIEFLKTIRDEYPDLPFILYTGKGSEAVASDAISAGVTDYLQKHGGTEQYELLANRILNAVEQKRAKQRAAQLEEEHQLIADVATDAFFVIDFTTGELRVSDGISQFGYDPGAVDKTEEWWTAQIHPEDREWMQQRHEAAMQPDETGFEKFTGEKGWFESEYQWQRADGSYAYVVGRGVTLFDDGDAVKQIVTMQDITDRKEREERLKQSNARLQALFENSPDMINIHTIDGTIIDVNQKFCEVFDQLKDELTGRKVWEIDQNLDPKSLRENLDGMEIGDQLEVETEFGREEGEKFPAEVRIARLPIDDGERFMVISRDISERKEFERQLKEQRDNLEVLNQVLRHDIRNDLQLVTAYTDMLANSVDEEHQEYVETVKENAKHAIELTITARDMADVWLSVEDRLCPIILKSTLENELDEIRASHTDSVITVKSDIPDVTVLADDMLNSVFHNILQNAIRHSDKDIPKVEISVEEGEETVLVRFADNGPGVPDNQKETIFGKGEKWLDSSGTGLGLYLVKILVENYEGDVWVKDNEPEGAVFVVELQMTNAEG
jgi:PAS domain S-box-containing protein